MNIEDLPLKNESVDLSIVAHVLYHVRDRDRAIRKVVRVSKPKSRVVITTIGQNHLSEVADMLTEFDKTFRSIRLSPDSFPPDSAVRELEPFFTDIKVYDCYENLFVTDGQAFLDFLMATHLKTKLDSIYRDLSAYFSKKIKKNGFIKLVAHGCAVTGIREVESL